MKINIYVDGSANHNRGLGPAGAGVVVEANGQEIEDELVFQHPLRTGTNNYAELYGIFKALLRVQAYWPHAVVAIHSDSQYAVRCSRGIWSADPDKTRNYELIQEIRDLLSELPKVALEEIPRAKNKAADAAAKGAMRKARELYGNS